MLLCVARCNVLNLGLKIKEMIFRCPLETDRYDFASSSFDKHK